MKSVSSALLSMLILLGGSGCAVVAGYHGWGTATDLLKHNELARDKKYDEALQLIRREMEQPSTLGSSFDVNLRVIAINDLAGLASQQGKVGFWVDSEYDAQAIAWMNEGLAKALVDKTGQAGLVWASYANYLDNTGRKGQSIFYRIVGTRALAAIAPVPALQTARQAADAAEQMGDPEMAALARLTFFQTFQAVNEKLTAEQRASLLISDFAPAIDATAGPSVEDVDKYWVSFERIEASCKKGTDCDGLMSLPRLSVAKAYARRGAAARAREIRDPALRYADKHFDENSRALHRLIGQCLEVQLATADRRDAEVGPAYDACMAAISAAGGEGHLGISTLDHFFYVDLALAAGEARLRVNRPVEAAANFGEAITLIERQRGIYDVGQLGRFFGSPRNKRAYSGMLLAQIGASAGKFDAAARDRILNVAELTRARQLREMRARRNGQFADAATFDVDAYLHDSPRIGQLIRGLPPRAALLYYVVLDDRVVAIVADSKGQDIVVLKLTAEELRGLVDTAAARLAAGTDLSGTEAALTALSRAVIEPVEPRLRPSTMLYVVPDDSLNRIPFATLSLSGKKRSILIESRSLITLPALDLLQASSSARAGPDKLLALGDPVYPDLAPLAAAAMPQSKEAELPKRSAAPVLQRLPETRDEVIAIGNRFGVSARELLLGNDASESKFKREPLETFRFIHLATHGMLSGDIPGVNEPSLALASGGGEDGLLKMSEVVTLKLNARLTVLSACNTGSGQFVAGEGVLGMGRAFLVAGSDSVVMSLWPVASKETADLMTDFYGRLATTPQTAEALRASMLALRAKKPHPFYWAPFVIMGRG